MLSNYALALYRTLSRHRLYAALNTLGLALGIAVCAVLVLVVRFETGFDRWVPDAQNIYRINHLELQPGRPLHESPATQPVLLPALLADFPQIRAAARLMGITPIVRSGPEQAYEDVVLADPTIFDVFQLPFTAGERSEALGDNTSLVISQAKARKYFGTDRALGRTLTLVIDGRARDYRITGVLKDLPADSHLELNFIGRYSPEILPDEADRLNSWGSSMLYTYLRLRTPAEAAALQSGFPAFINRHVGKNKSLPASLHMQFDLVPLTAIHFKDAKTDSGFKPGADALFVGALGLMGLVTLLTAIVNYVSLATARAGMRAREVAVRKVMGATRRALIVQFVGESVAMALAAGLIAAALVELVMPGVGAILGEDIKISYFGADGVALPLVGLCLLVGLLCGLYPALVLSGFRPASVLASTRTPGGGRAGARVREALAVFQFGIAITLMICTAVIFTQMEYVRNADVGFRRNGLVVVRGLGEREVAPHMHALVDAFRQVPGVISVSASDRRPATDFEGNVNVGRIDNPAIEPILTVERIGPEYVQTYGLHVLAGRPLGMTQRLDDRGGLNSQQLAERGGLNIMVNAGAARALGFPDPGKAVGARLRFGSFSDAKPLVGTVVGVVQDVRFTSPRRPAPPQFYMQNSALGPADLRSPWSAVVLMREDDVPAVTKRLEAVWRRFEPGTPFRSDTVKSALQPYYDPDARRGQLFATGAVLSVLIACLGLYGLAAFNTGRRVKEIGIRKTLGASTADVMRLLIGEFLRPVLIANLVAWPIAWFAMRAWLSGFDQRIALSPAYFLAPTVAAVVVAVVTVAEQTLRVARAEPASALRYE